MKLNQQAYHLKHRLFLFLGTIIFTFAFQAQAQKTHLSLVISVKDSNGAVISGASVTIDQEGCQCGACPADVKDCKSQCCDTRTNPPTCCIAALTSTSNDEGNVTFEVNPGRYSARIEVQNFKAKKIEGIQVTTGQSNKVEVTLDSGVNITDVVSVTTPSKQGRPVSAIPKTLTVKVENESEVRGNITVMVRRIGCSCGECPTGKVCPSGCCECKQDDCVCCIVASEITDKSGALSFGLQPGKYDVSFKVADTSWGTLSGVTIDSNARAVTLPVTILKAIPPQ